MGLEDLLYQISAVMLFALFIFGIQIFIYFPKVQLQLLKAKMFLNRPLMNRMWLTSVMSGGLFVCYGAVRVVNRYELYPLPAFLEPLAVVVFLVPYLGLTFQWYSLIKQSIVKE